ncbi:MAG TPA: glycosyltransferase family 4 protein [Novosphingobium sp.]|nr:glycosyltransferase family 4 protein [Novosphingobium sp.]
MASVARGEEVLFVSRQRLVGRTNGSSAYLLDLAQSAREAGFVPHLVQPTPRVAGRWPFLRLRPEMAVFESHAIRGLWRIGDVFISPSPTVWWAAGRGVLSRLLRRAGLDWAWLRDRPFGYVIAEKWRPADLRYLARRGRRGAIAVLDYMFCAEGLRGLAGPKRSAIVMHDLFHARQGAQGDTVTSIDRDAEVALLGQADAVIAIQASEAGFVAANLPDSEVILAPIAAQGEATPSAGQDDCLLFVGSNTGPNVVGLRWFLTDVWPLVRAARPDARLQVAGMVGWAFAGEAFEGVSFLGMVDSLEPLYAQAGVVISPLTFGSGLKIKLIEALAHGKAVVCTSVTLQGVEGEAGPAVALADSAEGFAQATIALCGDGAARQLAAEAAVLAVEAHFSRSACHRGFVDWLRRGG